MRFPIEPAAGCGTGVAIVAFSATALVGGPAGAVVVNIDWNSPFASDPLDATHNGDDGVFSTPGQSLWNGLDASAAGPFPGLLDEAESATPIEVRHVFPSGGYGEFGPFGVGNDLQTGGFNQDEIEIVVPDVTFDIALYPGDNTIFTFEAASGQFFIAPTNDPTFVLPGLADGDYVELLGVSPIEVSSEGQVEHVFRIYGFDGQIVGMQLRYIIPVPATMATMLAIGPVAAGRRRRQGR